MCMYLYAVTKYWCHNIYRLKIMARKAVSHIICINEIENKIQFQSVYRRTSDWTAESSIPDRGKRLSLFHSGPDRFCRPPSLF